MLYKDIDLMFSNDWFTKFINAKEKYEARRDSLEANEAYKKIRKELKRDFELMKM